MHDQVNRVEQNIIPFLAKKIATLSKSLSFHSAKAYESNTSTQATTKSFNLQNLISNHARNLSLPMQRSPTLQQRQITIVGGGGRMGRFFGDRLSQQHQVNILEHDDWGQAEKLLADVDLVLVCVPLDCTVKTIEKLSPYLSPQTALADIASIKAPMVKAMLEFHNGAVMGLHPMFGPNLDSFSAQKVVICSGRQDQAFQWFLELIKSDGGELIYATPEEHDRLMTTVQAIRNFATLSFGLFLSQEEVELERTLNVASPMYSQQIAMVQRLFVQSAPLIVDLMLATPERRTAISRLGNACCQLAQLVQQGDREALINEFRVAQDFFTSK